MQASVVSSSILGRQLRAISMRASSIHTTHLRAPPIEGALFESLLEREPKRPSRTLDVRNRERPARLNPSKLINALEEEFRNATESEAIVDSEIAAAKAKARARVRMLERRLSKIPEGWGQGAE